ncbi:glyoxylate/succinic semialdehyde reductase 1-like isoform X1 [Patiria miniata]|uniref:Cytokine-like nuclear factor N-PAC n=1 Tax=Patiria miniata TaxID=46514 RepID=A0A913ZXH0_PATMI|nr:glyoxylate/succinic semialdehyde reductase 1-like isoform X1 [Patiria miniata]
MADDQEQTSAVDEQPKSPNEKADKEPEKHEFKFGEHVWAKLSSFPHWPGRIVKPWKHVKKPPGKKLTYFVFFFGTEDHAWVRAENLCPYLENKERLSKAAKGQKFKKAMDAIEDAIRQEENKKASPLSPFHPKDDEEIFPPKSKPMKDYSREPLTGKAKLNSTPDDRGKTSPEQETEKSPKKRGRALKDTASDSTPTKTSYASPKKRAASSALGSPSSKKQAKGNGLSFNSLALYNSFQAHLSDRTEDKKEDIVPTDKKIGFIGLGLMGTGMAMNLIKTGHKVTVWNRTAAKCADFVTAGATEAKNVSDLVSECDIVFSMVSDSEALRAIVFGEHGVLDGMKKGKALVDMSTVDIGTVTGLEGAITAREGRFLEAPVVGSVQPAMEGSLVIIGAGDSNLFDDCTSCFQAMGKKAFFLGDVGNGSKMKIIINMITGCIMSGFAEGMAVADRAGLSQETLLDVLNLGAISSPLISGKGKAILANKYPPAFPLKYQQKDMRLALALADQVEQPIPVSAAVNELFKRAKNLGLGEKDISAVYKAVNM